MSRAAWNQAERIRIIERLAARDGAFCFYCGIRLDSFELYVVEHFIPHTHGGSHHDKNLRIACPACDARKGAYFPGRLTPYELKRHRCLPTVRHPSTCVLCGQQMSAKQITSIRTGQHAELRRKLIALYQEQQGRPVQQISDPRAPAPLTQKVWELTDLLSMFGLLDE